MNFDEFCSRLDGVKGSGTQRSARCPAHDDTRQSLSVSQGNDGRILVTCQRGCHARGIVGAMGLDMKDLFPKAQKSNRAPVTATYQYHDENGNLLAEKLRRSDKSFTWRQPDKDHPGKWKYNRQDLTVPPYHIPDVLKAEHVYIVEGEKDADALKEHGFTATTGADGAGPGKWRSHYNQWFQGKAVTILPDNDVPGKEYAAGIAKALYGIANSIKLLDLSQEWPELPVKGDISDVLLKHGAEDTLVRLIALDGTTAEYEPPAMREDEPIVNAVSVKPADFTDTGNARIFAQEFNGKAIYVRSIGWLVWDGTKWKESELEAVNLAMRLTDKMMQEAAAQFRAASKEESEAILAEDSDAKTKAKDCKEAAEGYLKHARTSRNRPKIVAMLGLACSLMQVEPDQLDAHPYLLNTPAGIVDLKTKQILPHDPDKLCSKITSCSPGNKGKHQWNDFLNTICNEDEKMINLLQQIAGMAAVGKVFEELLIMALGGGGNGKSAFFNTLAAVLSEYAGTIAAEVLTTSGRSQGAELATLKGKRLVIAAETDEGVRLSASMLKQIASTDKIHAERKYKDPEDFTPSHSTVLYTNHAPRVGSTDTGTWRRLVLIPFMAKIKATQEVKNYSDVLLNEAGEAILSWIIEGAANYIAAAHKLILPEFVHMAIEEYQSQNDWMSEFLEEFCEEGQGQNVKARKLYQTYHDWAKDAHSYARRVDSFTAELEKKGFEKRKTNQGIIWYGLSLRPEIWDQENRRFA